MVLKTTYKWRALIKATPEELCEARSMKVRSALPICRGSIQCREESDNAAEALRVGRIWRIGKTNRPALVNRTKVTKELVQSDSIARELGAFVEFRVATQANTTLLQNIAIENGLSNTIVRYRGN